MECPYCKTNIDLKKIWKEKPFKERFKASLIYCFKVIEKPSLDYFLAPPLFLLTTAAGLFLIFIVWILFDIYSDYKAGIEVLNRISKFLLFLLGMAMIFALSIFALYHMSTEKIELLFKIVYISIKCPHCKKEIKKGIPTPS